LAGLVDRADSPWDDPQRRPSHANRQKALRAEILRNELSTIVAQWSLPEKIIRFAELSPPYPQDFNCFSEGAGIHSENKSLTKTP
jgi:hypothetical protein